MDELQIASDGHLIGNDFGYISHGLSRLCEHSLHRFYKHLGGHSGGSPVCSFHEFNSRKSLPENLQILVFERT